MNPIHIQHGHRPFFIHPPHLFPSKLCFLIPLFHLQSIFMKGQIHRLLHGRILGLSAHFSVQKQRLKHSKNQCTSKHQKPVGHRQISPTKHQQKQCCQCKEQIKQSHDSAVGMIHGKQPQLFCCQPYLKLHFLIHLGFLSHYSYEPTPIIHMFHLSKFPPASLSSVNNGAPSPPSSPLQDENLSCAKQNDN